MKYKLTDQHTIINGIKLYRIEALKDFSNVKKGDIGGFIESEHNLSQDGDCWVYDNATVSGDAQILFDAQIFNNAQISDSSVVTGGAKVFGSAKVHSGSYIYGQAKVYDHAIISEHSNISSNAEVFGSAKIVESNIDFQSKISGDTIIRGPSFIRNSEISVDQDFKNIFLNNVFISNENQYSAVFLKFRGHFIYSYIKRNNIIYSVNGKEFNNNEFRRLIEDPDFYYYPTKKISDHRKELLDIITLNQIKLKSECNFVS